MAELEELEYADESGEGEDDQEDEFEQMLGMNAKRDVWKDNLTQKNEVVRELIKCFASMVETRSKEFSVPNHRGKINAEDKVFEKLLDAPKFVTRAKRALISHENFDQRNFSIFIAHKGWIKHILRPLLELCAKDDSILAMRCCSLALVLIRRISDASQKVLTEATKGTKRKASSLDLQQNEDDKEDDEKPVSGSGAGESGGAGKGRTGALGSDDKKKEQEREALLSRIDNVKQQISALLSFKEALCSDKCNEAISNAFKEFWLKEQAGTTEDNKTGVAICFSYLRRILAIDSNAHWSSGGEIQLHRTVHDKYIVQLRLLLSVIPGVCSDLLDAYHNDWLGDIILIIYFTLRGFEPKDLHRVWRTGALISDFTSIDTYDALEGNGGSAGADKSQADVVVPSALTASVRNSTALGKGRLSQALQRERNNSLASTVVSGGSGVSRFRGVYQKSVAGSVALPTVNTTSSTNNSGSTNNSVLDAILGPSTTTNDTSTDTPATTVTTVHLQTSKIVRDPFSTSAGTTTSAVQAKRNKKNLTFNVDDTIATVGSAQHTTSTTHQKASVVAATLANLLSDELSLKPLVKRVNDDLRRDDMRVGSELELKYFDILYRVLHYNRLKLADQYREFQSSAANIGTVGQSASNKSGPRGAEVKAQWEPNLKNVMDALDRMSFMRVVTSIERLGKNPLNADDIVVPLALFKEMVCYLRILLESDLIGHHEIAVAALYRLYYASSERLDPLPKLLSAWKSGTYPKRHLHTLVELVHETLKTLDTAQVRFKAEGVEDAKKPRKKNKSEMDMEQYTLSCMRFSVDEYFKRYIATNHTVRMYTKLLSHYIQNDNTVNYYVYTYLRRLNMYVLEQEHRAPMPVSVVSSVNGVGVSSVYNAETTDNIDQVSLSFMLFNIHSLEVFSTILNDREIYNNKAFEPLLRLIKSMVRRFGAAVTKNHMLFVELLFVHPRPHDFCTSVDSVYEASAYATYNTSGSKRHKHSTHTDGTNTTNNTTNTSNSSDSSSSSDSEAADYGDEFDENNLTAAFAADPQVAKSSTKGSSKSKKGSSDSNTTSSSGGRLSRKNKDRKKRSRESSGLSDSSDSDGGNSDTDGGVGSGGKERGSATREKRSKKDKTPRSTEAPKQARVSGRTSSRGWTAEEDAVLAAQYALYAGSHSVFTSIAQCPELRAFGMQRNEAQVAKRVTQLRLHMNISFSDSSDGEDRAARGGAKKGRGSDEEVETQEQRASQAHNAVHSRGRGHSEDFILFSDHDEHSDSGNSNSASDMEVETQAQTQGQSSPHSSAGADDAAELAGLFSPLPNTGNTSTGGSGGKRYGSSNKKARVSSSTVDSASLPRAAWDVDDDGPDLLEQRSLALMRSRGEGAGGLSDDEDSLFGGTNSTNNKKNTTTTSTTVKRGLSKSAVRKPVVDSDEESLEFESSTSTTANTTANNTNSTSTSNTNTISNAESMYKKRLMRIDSDDDE